METKIDIVIVGAGIAGLATSLGVHRAMELVVENLTGTLFHVQVGYDATVQDLKREIGAQQKLPCDRLILVLDADHNPLISKEEETISLVDYGVQDGSHIYLFFNPIDDESNNHFVFSLPEFLLG